jgi:glycosyltransferase domain-containing protein
VTAPSADLRVTLLVPTMNRSEFVIRMLRYYAEAGFKGRIAIGDSSGAEHLARSREAVASLHGALDVVHEEYPKAGLGVALQKLLVHVNTPYAATLPDDDFLVPESLDACARFLSAHPDYAAAHGLGVGVNLDSNGLHGQVTACAFYPQPVIDGDTAVDRLQAHLEDYRVSMFSVHRLPTWQAMLRDVHLQADVSFSAELLPCCLTVVHGKVKQLDCLYVVRQNHDLRYELPDAYDWVTGPKWQASYQVFADGLAEALAVKDGLSIEVARKAVKRAFKEYLVSSLGVKRRWAGPHWTLEAARTGKRLLNSLKPKQHSAFELTTLLQPASPYHAAFMPVYRVLVTPEQDGRPVAAAHEETRA